MTKKLLALGLSLTMALSLAACGGDSRQLRCLHLRLQHRRQHLPV